MAKRAKAKTKRPSPGKAKRAAKRVKPIPAGYHSVTPYITVRGAAEAIDFYERAFGAREVMRMPWGEGTIGHAEIRIGDSVVMLSDEMPGAGTKSPQALGGTTGSVFVYVPNVDAVVDRAVKAGARLTMPPTDMFWGDRFGTVVDPFGHTWGFATHQEDVPPKQLAERAKAARAQAGPSG